MAELFCFVLEMNQLFFEYQTVYNKELTVVEKQKEIIRYLKYNYDYKRDSPFYYGELRPPAFEKDNKKPNIVIFGCSFAYGHMLDNKDSIHSVLSKQIKRDVYNFGVPSTSPREILWMLENINDKNNENDYISQSMNRLNNTDYVIYIAIEDHINRLYYDLNEFSPHYKIYNNTLIKNKHYYQCFRFYKQYKK